jgi:hypothetical protein
MGSIETMRLLLLMPLLALIEACGTTYIEPPAVP